MKTKAFILVCLFIGIGLTQVSAQLKWNTNEKGTGTLEVRVTFENFGIPVYCGNEQVDLLVGNVTTHNIYRFKNNVYWGANEHYFGGNFKSTWTDSDEIFKVMEKDHGFDIVMDGESMLKGTDNYHFNIIGNKGTHYTGKVVFDIPTQSITYAEGNCH